MSTRKAFLILSLLALALLALGCSQKAVEPVTAVEEPNLTGEFGGYLATDATPGFGDDVLLADAAEGGEEYDDPILALAGLDSILQDANSGHYHLRIIWGQLRYDSTLNIPTDWTGSLSISRGVEILRRTIQFERGLDYIKPRRDRHLIEWVSRTSTRSDGIAVDIFVPPLRPKLDTTEVITTDSLGNEQVIIAVDTTWPVREPVTVDFKTAPYSRTFNLEELASLDTIVYLDDSNAVAFHAFKLDRTACPRGFLAGRWGFEGTDSGVFCGVWMDLVGRVDGYLKGHFGKKDNGEQVFFGKWISRLGRFEGFIRGHWGFVDCTGIDPNNPCHLGGFFRGRIFDADRKVMGGLAGRFRDTAMTDDVPAGFFQGRWKLFCPGDSIMTRNMEEGF